MSTVDLVLWLPRSREHAPGEYQYRIWTTFEATVVALRDLRVVAIGYKLSWTQWQVAFSGSYLLLPLWSADDGSGGVVNLGRANLSALLSLLLAIMLYVMTDYYTGHSNIVFNITTVNGTELEYRGIPLAEAQLMQCLWLGFLVLIFYSVRVSMLQEVMLARNGAEVLRVMLSHARSPLPCDKFYRDWLGVGNKNERQIAQQLTQHLPWLKAYDRRDALTVKHVLDVMAADMANDGMDHPMDADAAALSSYICAAGLQSPGDAIEGRSLRSWFAATGSSLFRATSCKSTDCERPASHGGPGEGSSAGSAALPGIESEPLPALELSTASLTPTLYSHSQKRGDLFLRRRHVRRHWMDAFPILDPDALPSGGAGVVTSELALPTEDGVGVPPDLQRIIDARELKETDELWLSELSRCGWSVSLAWPRCVVVTPLCCFSAPPPVRHKGLTIWLLKDLIPIERPVLVHWAIWGNALNVWQMFASLIMFMAVSGGGTTTTAQLENVDIPQFWWAFVTLAQALNFIWLTLCRFKADVRNIKTRRKLRKSGRFKGARCNALQVVVPLVPTGKIGRFHSLPRPHVTPSLSGAPPT